MGDQMSVILTRRTGLLRFLRMPSHTTLQQHPSRILRLRALRGRLHEEPDTPAIGHCVLETGITAAFIRAIREIGLVLAQPRRFDRRIVRAVPGIGSRIACIGQETRPSLCASLLANTISSFGPPDRPRNLRPAFAHALPTFGRSNQIRCLEVLQIRTVMTRTEPLSPARYRTRLRSARRLRRDQRGKFLPRHALDQ